MMRRWVGAALLLILTACATQEAPAPEATTTISFRNVSTEVAYVGDATCATCHEEAYQGYQEHGMAQSFYRLTPETLVETFPSEEVIHEPTGFRYRMVAEEDGYFQEEYLVDENGEPFHEMRRRIDYVVGSGTAARTYLTEEDGRVYQMPITWYTQAEQWDFSPGYDKGNKRFDRLVPDRCMACHNSYPTPEPFTDGKYVDVPLGIGCERCHGPGDLHVEARLADPEPSDEVDDTIVNPAHLTLERSLDVCHGGVLPAQ